ncbi:hypothetical protein [Desulfomicrobium orale]|uniref:hypothetical protein n=1 Tax=Desulfomicrobium orale TaxID=132132 RepID=UPI0012487276|nr:hypothetical protein [Desulfomicrobium orale]
MVKIFRFLLVAVLVSSLILHVGYRRAEAIAPAIPFMAMVLSAVATGSAIGYMSYNANGKEIYVKMKGALKDGVRVTKDWVQRQIAEINGISVDGLDGISLDGMFVNLSGKKYRILEPFELNYATSNPELNAEIQGWSYTSGGEGNIYHTIGFKRRSFERDGILYNVFDVYNVSHVGPSEFDPADYPALYSGPAFLINCHAVAKAHPDLVPIYEISDVKPEGFDEANATVQEIGGYTNGYVIDAEGNKYDVNGILAQASGTLTTSNGTTYNLENYVASGNYIQAANGRKIYISDITSKDPGSAKITTADGREYYLSKDSGPKVIDSTGNVLHMPPGEVLDALGGAKPTLDWSSYSDSYISTSPVAIDTPNENKGKKLLPGWLGSRLKQAGIDLGAGSVIDSVSNGRVNWTDSSGVSRTTVVNTELTDALVRAGAAQRVTTKGRSVTIQNAQSTVINNAGAVAETPNIDFGPDPGNPSDSSLPDVPLFDPAMDWGEEKPWPWADWIGALPFVDVLKSSSIDLSGATSVVSFEFSILGTSKVISYDFSQWNSLLNSMGIVIYACACWYALQLALLKRD